MAEALWFLANNFHWICGIYFRGKYSVCCQNWKQQRSYSSSPCQADIMAFDYSLWMSPLACQAALPLPPPACCLKLCCLVGVRQSGVQLLLLKLVATDTVYTVAARKYMDRSIMQKAPLLKLFHCRASSASASPIDFYANKILRLLLLFPLLASSAASPLSSFASSSSSLGVKSKTLIFIYRRELSSGRAGEGSR